jgi:aryl-alcohol dehydrogenase-like predicted oxidoreductase
VEYRQLGTTGLRVSSLCLGAMNLGSEPGTDDEGVAVIRAAVDAGVNFVDTANVYGQGHNEEVVGRALQGIRDEVVLATKVAGLAGPGPNDHGVSRRAINLEAERSLRRLGTDWIDLYQIHHDDPATPLDESLEALDDLVRAGKVRYAGVSNFSGWRITRAHWIAAERRLRPIASEQPPYNMLERAAEREVIPACRAFGMGVIPWSPMAGGLLSGRVRGGVAPEGGRSSRVPLSEPERAPVVEVLDRLGALAGEAGVPLSRLALAWVRDAEGVTAPLVGPRTAEQLADALASLDVTIDAGLRARIDEVVPPGRSLWREAAEATQRRQGGREELIARWREQLREQRRRAAEQTGELEPAAAGGATAGRTA